MDHFLNILFLQISCSLHSSFCLKYSLQHFSWQHFEHVSTYRFWLCAFVTFVSSTLSKNPGSPKEAAVCYYRCYSLVSEFHHDSSRWWFHIFFYFHPYFIWGFMIHFDEHIFEIGLLQPPTSRGLSSYERLPGICWPGRDRSSSRSLIQDDAWGGVYISWRGGLESHEMCRTIFFWGKNGRIARKVSWVMSEFGSASSEETT